MKTFKDLNFQPYGYEQKVADKLYDLGLSYEDFEKKLFAESPAKNAVIHFKNGWGVSVVFGKGCWYSNGIDTYEVGIMYHGMLKTNSAIFYDEVAPHQTKEQVTEIMLKLQYI